MTISSVKDKGKLGKQKATLHSAEDYTSFLKGGALYRYQGPHGACWLNEPSLTSVKEAIWLTWYGCDYLTQVRVVPVFCGHWKAIPIRQAHPAPQVLGGGPAG